jgi:hypothetical protein
VGSVGTNGHTANGDCQIRVGIFLGLGILISLPLASKHQRPSRVVRERQRNGRDLRSHTARQEGRTPHQPLAIILKEVDQE